MQRILLPIIFLSCVTLTGCEKLLLDDMAEKDPVVNFDYLWHRVDCQYSMFDVKGIDWQAVYDSLRPEVYSGMRQESLFDVMARMLNHLDDGHVNLTTPFDISRSETVWQRRQWRKNIDERTVALYYLGSGYHTTAGLLHNVIADSAVIYVRYSSFEYNVSAHDLRYILTRYRKAQGMILDLRQNGGGRIANIWELLDPMASHGQLLYTTQIKSGPGHDEFSAPTAVTAPIHSDENHYRKPVVVLTDRGTFSAASLMALCAKSYDQMILIGDTTGGGLGMPTEGEIPNGWLYRFSVTRTLAPDGVNYENGMPPDYTVMLRSDAIAAGHDNVIDSAVAVIQSQTSIED